MNAEDPDLPEGVERSLDEAFAKVAGLTGFTPIETARLFVSYSVNAFEVFCCGETLLDELDMAVEFIAEAKARIEGVKH